MAYNFFTTFTYTNGAAFPSTAAINASGSGTADGTEFKKQFVDDLWGFVQALLYNTGQTPSNLAEVYNSSQLLNAVKLYAGVYTYASGMSLKAGNRIMSPIPGDYMFYYITADATASNTANVIADFKTDLAAGKFQYHGMRRGSKRHTTVQGSVDANGKANFLKIVGTGISIDATPVPVQFSIASGFDFGGNPIDRPITLTADETPAAWDGLANGTHYLYVDYNNGTKTYGSSTLKPIYDVVYPSAPAAGQHFFSINEKKMYYWSGAAWVQVDRIFAGRAIFSAGSPTEIRTWSYNGRYDSGWFAVAASTNYTIYHDNGCDSDIYFEFSLDSAGADHSRAHDGYVDGATAYLGHVNREDVANSDNDLYIKFGFLNNVQYYRSANRTTGYYRVIAKRSW